MHWPSLSGTDGEVNALRRELPSVEATGERQRILLNTAFVQQHQRPLFCEQAVNVSIGAEFVGVVLNRDPPAFDALTVRLNQALHGLVFRRTVGVNGQSAHAGVARSCPLKSLAEEQDHEPTHPTRRMGWWPFRKKARARSDTNDPILKDTRTWLAELRDACEMNFDQPEEARRQIRHMQVEWKEAMDRGDMAPSLREGLEGRAFRLLSCTDKEWLGWLDDLDFWKAGWKPGMEGEDEA